MKIMKKHITEKHIDEWIPNCGPFTQVRLYAILKDSLTPTLICHFVGIQAKLLASSLIADKKWATIEVVESMEGPGEYDLLFDGNSIGELDEKEKTIVIDPKYEKIAQIQYPFGIYHYIYAS